MKTQLIALQAYSGVFHLLPLGLRVQDKLERLIDKHMGSLGGCLSTEFDSTAYLNHARCL